VIEHSSQAIVFQNCFRLVRFSLQIAAQAVDPPVFRRAPPYPQRIERPRQSIRPG